MLLLKTKKSKIWTLTLLVSIISLFSIFLRYENLKLDTERKFIKICLNKQEFINEWTLFTGRH